MVLHGGAGTPPARRGASDHHRLLASLAACRLLADELATEAAVDDDHKAFLDALRRAGAK